jgi:hypothetical protein
MESKKVEAYLIINADDSIDLATNVMRLLKIGYELYGNPFVTTSTHYNGEIMNRFNQAVVKYGK